LNTTEPDDVITNSEIPVEAASEPPPKPQRLVSLDAFRGFTIAGMLLVNNASMDTATPKPLMHAEWNQGITFADLVFPWFLFIVGIAIPFSKASQRQKGMSGLRYLFKALVRCITLVLLGCLIDSSLAKRPLFDLGVLQVIGLAYFLSTIIYELPAWLRYCIAGILLYGHWFLLKHVGFPGGAAGVFLENLNIIKYINESYLQVWGLKGLVSVIPTTALVIIGTGIGDLLRRDGKTGAVKTLWISVIGISLCAVGWMLSHNIPFNKPTWTASYIIEAAGLGCLMLVAFYWVVDVRGMRILAVPLLVFGMNAIAAYVSPILVKVLILREWTLHMPDGSRLSLMDAALKYCTDSFGRISGGWVYTCGYIAVWWLVMLCLYRRKVFFKV